MRIEVMLEDVGVGENGAKCKLLVNIPLHTQGWHCETSVYELGQCWEKGIELKLADIA
jgi:hypothetical protein